MRLTNLKVNALVNFDRTLRVEINTSPSEELIEILKGEVDIDITPHKEKRSLSANGYAWVLIDKLAEKLNRSQSEVYREAIKDIGGVSEYVCIKKEASEKMQKIWTSKGLGWQCEELDSKIAGCVNLRLVYGSSVYDTKQMSSLIDHLVQDCEAVGISTLTPSEIANLISMWEEA